MLQKNPKSYYNKCIGGKKEVIDIKKKKSENTTPKHRLQFHGVFMP